MITNILGYPRIGEKRELKKSLEQYWAGKIPAEALLLTAKEIRQKTWTMMKDAGVDLIPSNDFSLYDQVLDMTCLVGAIPERYKDIDNPLDQYFAMARGMQAQGTDVIAMEMTKWFDTNYHYIVPEFTSKTTFKLSSSKPFDEFAEAKALGITTKPVIIGPMTYLLLGKSKELVFEPIELIDKLVPVYIEILKKFEDLGAEWIQIDEPMLALEQTEIIKALYKDVYEKIAKETKIKIILTTYFDGLDNNIELACSLPVKALHVDVVRCREQLRKVVACLGKDQMLSLGIIDGRNIWINDLKDSKDLLDRVANAIGRDNIMISTSCSLLHVPYDLNLETNEKVLTLQIKQWMAFARQKVREIMLLHYWMKGEVTDKLRAEITMNGNYIDSRRTSRAINNPKVKERVSMITRHMLHRASLFTERKKKQEALGLPLFPTTTIGSFPQTQEVRQARAKFKKGELSEADYIAKMKEETEACIRYQEQIGLDVLVHGEFERNDMVEYFGQQLSGFTFTEFGWVQSYGSRCVKPPVIYGDVSREKPMTLDWAKYSQSLTQKYVKGMLTGPVTILEWSFVRNDQPRKVTCQQIALAIRDEVSDLESAGIKIIQIDEPAIREGLPLKRSKWKEHLQWAVDCFCLATACVSNTTQIHTHMCYSEFNDIITDIARMDADVITIECSRSQMELLEVFQTFRYPNDIGPGVYDIHSARVPSVDEMVNLMKKAASLIPAERLWINPDCGLKTRGWEETKAALENMIKAAETIRKDYQK